MGLPCESAAHLKMTRLISIVIPVYNSAQTLNGLAAHLDTLRATFDDELEAVLVDDGSSDQSSIVMQNLAKRYPWIRCISLMRNYGQHNAILCGIRNARGNVIVTMDDDLQNPPDEIQNLLSKLEEGHDVVYGYPLRESHGFMRDLASRITKLALRDVMGVKVANRVSGFRAFRTELRDSFCDYHGAFVSIDVLLAWGTTRFAAVPVRNPPRPVGKSNYTVAKLLVHAMNMITGFTALPLQLASILGFLFALFGLFVLFYVVGRYLLVGDSVPGFPFLASILSIFSGVQLFALGIIGEYLARMHFRLMDRPSYAIRQSISQNDRSSM